MTSNLFPDTPSLSFLLGANFYPYFEEHVLDAGQALDRGIRIAAEENRLAANEEDLADVLGRSLDEASAMANLMPWLSQTGIPDGNTYRGFLEAALSRVRQALADPESIPDPGEEGDGLRPQRVSRFHDEATANEVSTLVLRAHAQQVRAWAENPGGWWRQHYYVADVGRSTGVMVRHGVEEKEEVGGAVVVMKRDHDTGQPFILTAYPEPAMPTVPRSDLPDLCHVLGGYFGQDCYDEGGPLQSQHNFQATTTDPARGRVAEQLDALLRRHDDRLRADVEALGCYVLPVALRSWLMRMRWRMDAFDWSQPTEQR